ncbi:DNA helicase loader [Aeromonas phage phiAS4]|uniref:DNA helicase loader n=1 Tax=Aeromonas phage phiAS4 TaxID=879628 RepID=E1A197_9CAUD|nr:DNA helicase loader [Aeromonas phage phiAS4]ADM79621.1 DNA helicase loader [Aeromonas phage phiAS4]
MEYNEKQQTSPIFKLLQSGLIKTETFLVIDSFLGIIDKIDEKMSADIIWQNWHTKLVNYRKLVVINNDIAKAKFIQHVKEFKAEV